MRVRVGGLVGAARQDGDDGPVRGRQRDARRDEPLPGGERPVLGEDGREVEDRGPLDPQVRVVPGAVPAAAARTRSRSGSLRVLVADVHASGEADPLVDDEELAVVPEVGRPALAKRVERQERLRLPSRRAQRLEALLRDVGRADGVVEEPDVAPRPRPLGEVGEERPGPSRRPRRCSTRPRPSARPPGWPRPSSRRRVRCRGGARRGSPPGAGGPSGAFRGRGPTAPGARRGPPPPGGPCFRGSCEWRPAPPPPRAACGGASSGCGGSRGGSRPGGRRPEGRG